MEFKESGLNSEEAKKRLQEYGLNEIQDTSKRSPLKILLRQIKSNFIIYLLLSAMIISFFVGKTLTAYVIFGVIIIVISTGFVQEYKAEKAISALKQMIMPVSIVIRDRKEQEVNSNDLVPDDILILRTGEKIPADCVILQENELRVNESMLTGESEPVRKKAIKDIQNIKDINTLFMGSFIVNGSVTAKVIKTGMRTKFGRIAGMISAAEKELPLQKKVNKIAKYMAIWGVTFAILTGVIMLLRTPGFDNEMFINALIIVIAVAVASFPEGFPVVLITSLATGSYRMARKNAIVNRMSIIETLGETTVICSDKTGTITKGEMTVKRIITGDREFEVTGAGYEATGKFIYNGREINIKNEKTLGMLINSSILCNNSRIQRIGEDNIYKISGAPTEASLLITGAKAGIYKEDLKYQRIEEIPFSSERKMMSVLCKEKNELIVYSKGAIEVLLDRCKFIQKDSGVFRLLDKDKQRILKINEKLNSDAFRTLSFAHKKTNSRKKEEFENELIFLGLVAIEDPPREEVREALLVCKQAGIKVKMITGDNKKTAISISRQIGLDEGGVLEGYELDKMSHEDLVRAVKGITIFARVKPEHKLKIVKALKENGEIVTMTGDGVNDAPALKEAHIGVAMGKNGTDVSRSVADLTLKDDNFATIVDAIKEGRTIYTNIQKFTSYQISVNVAQVMLIFLAIAIGLPLPLVAIQILFMNIFSDELAALTLAFNTYSKDVMSSKPRKKSNIITKPIFSLIVIAGMIMCFGSLAVFYYVHDIIGKPEETARTVVFVTMVLFGLTNAFNFRSFRKLTFTRSPLVNKSLFIASLFAVLSTIIIIYTPVSRFLETVPIKFSSWILAFCVSLSVVIVFDIIKKLNNKEKFLKLD